MDAGKIHPKDGKQLLILEKIGIMYIAVFMD